MKIEPEIEGPAEPVARREIVPGQRPLITELVTSTTRDFLSREFQREVDAARDKPREQFDAQVAGAFAATLKSAPGLR